jgi:hypothetical protein
VWLPLAPASGISAAAGHSPELLLQFELLSTFGGPVAAARPATAPAVGNDTPHVTSAAHSQHASMAGVLGGGGAAAGQGATSPTSAAKDWGRSGGEGGATLSPRQGGGGSGTAAARRRDSAVALASIAVLPHHHTVYCDRKRQVCTAEGAVREGNRLLITSQPLGLPGPSDDVPQPAAGVVVTWYRSALPGDASQPAAAQPTAEHHPLHPESYTDASTGNRMVRVPARALADVFSAPAAPHLTVPADADARAAYREVLASLRAPDAAMQATSPLYSAATALRLLRAETAIALAHPLQYACGLADVGRYVSAMVTVPGHGTVHVPAVGPVEAAPPRIRELWVEGAPRVGATLVARSAYYGGEPGPCDFSWIRVDAEGNRTETEPQRAVPTAPLAADAGGGGGDDTDPRCLRLTPADVGCAFKVTCEPVRADGVRGAPTTSKPTADVCE